jgi:hypothetical protein
VGEGYEGKIGEKLNRMDRRMKTLDEQIRQVETRKFEIFLDRRKILLLTKLHL